MRLPHLTLGLIAGLSFATATATFAETAVQAGETLESLSKVKIVTTVNGQPGSLQDLVSSGQVQIISGTQAPTTAAPSSEQTPASAPPEIAPQDRPAQVEAESQIPSAAPTGVQAEDTDTTNPALN